MARPKADPAQRLSVKSAMHVVIWNENLSFSGHALENLFEPENIDKNNITQQIFSSGKWRRFLYLGKKPGEKSHERLEQLAPYSINHLNSPFWQSIRLDKTKEEDWIEFYNTLDLQVKVNVYQFIINLYSADEFLDKGNNPLNKLIRIGDDHAVSALMGLLRQYNETPVIRNAIETSLYNVIFNFLSRFCAPTFLAELYSYLYDNIFNSVKWRFAQSPWPSDLSELADIIWVEQKNLCLARELSIVDLYSSPAEFFYWKYRGNRHLIVREMVGILREPEFGMSAPKSKKGLRWLIKKLNKNRPSSHQISTYFF